MKILRQLWIQTGQDFVEVLDVLWKIPYLYRLIAQRLWHNGYIFPKERQTEATKRTDYINFVKKM